MFFLAIVIPASEVLDHGFNVRAWTMTVWDVSAWLLVAIVTTIGLRLTSRREPER